MGRCLTAILFALFAAARPACAKTLRVIGAGSLTEAVSDLLRRFPAGHLERPVIHFTRNCLCASARAGRGLTQANMLVRGLDCLDGTPLLDLKPDRGLFLPLAPPQEGDFQVDPTLASPT